MIKQNSTLQKYVYIVVDTQFGNKFATVGILRVIGANYVTL